MLHGPRRDLQDLRSLPRSAVLSFLQKQGQPREPRSREEAAAPASVSTLATLAPQNWWPWLAEYCRFRFGRRHDFPTYAGCADDNGIYRLIGDGDEIRIALAGDWGTGTDEAAAVARHIDEARERPHYSIHLGDVYYVGDPAEVAEKFLGISDPGNDFAPTQWPHGTQGTFALNGNHEMYARGYGYFDHILPAMGLAGRPGGQRASYFCLENDHWRIIAVDTGYNSIGWPLIENVIPPGCALPPALIDWLRDVVRPSPDDPRGIVLLSHHQPISRFDQCYAKPAEQLAPFFAGPVLWLWGHEHRLVVYKEATMAGRLRGFGRCIGHGGMPVDLPRGKVQHDYPTEFVDERLYPNDENIEVGYNGFVRMTLRGAAMTLRYVDLDGREIFSEAFAARQGALVRVTAPD